MNSEAEISEGEYEDDVEFDDEIEDVDIRQSKQQTQSKATKRKRTCAPREQPFMDSWLQITEFRSWLERKIGKDKKAKPHCKVCDKSITCSKTGIKRHSLSKKHKEIIKTTTTSGSLCQMMASGDATASMEIKLCAFIAQHNLPLSLSDDLIKFLRSLFPNDSAFKKVTLGKQKATNIIRQVLGFDYLEEIVSLLRARKFSIIIDEATDKSPKKQLAIVACFFDVAKFEMQYWLVDMIETEDGTAQGIYFKIKETFLELNIPMVNIIGFSSDTTNVMFGQYNSVAQLLKSEFPHIQIIKCSCHLIHLVSSHAALKLPKSIEDLCRDIYAHFHRSSKRQDVYREFQTFFETEPLNLLSLCQTRWLSLEACVNRILDQYLALKHYFSITANEDPSHSNDRILASLHNRIVQAYLEFLSFQLSRFNEFNRLFQSERPLLHILKQEVENLMRSIASDFMKLDIVKATEPKDLDPVDVNQHVPLREIYLGLAASATLAEIEGGAQEEDVTNFLKDCKNFLIESILQMQRRFDLNAEVHRIVQCLVPSFLGTITKLLPYLSDIFNLKQLDLEWRQHALEEGINSNLHWDEYWLMVCDSKTPTGEARYPCLMKFVGILSSLPFANVVVERIFSQLKLVKTDSKNSLKSSTLVSLLQSKMGMKNGHWCAASVQPNKRILQLASKCKSSATDEEIKELRKDFLQKLT